MTNSSTTLYLHPEYLYNKPLWQKAKDLYDGRHDVLTNDVYLPRHNIERITDPKYKEQSAELRLSRQQRTKYVNFTEILTSIWMSIFFKDKPTLNEAAIKLLDTDAENIDGQGNSIHAFVKNFIVHNWVNYGKAIVLADAPSGDFVSLGAQRAAGVRPYLKSIHPLNMPDWAYNNIKISELKFARHEYAMIEPRQSAASPIVQMTYSDEYLRDGSKVIINRYKRAISEPGLTQEKEKNPTKLDTLSSQEGWEVGDPLETEFDRIPISIIEDEPWLTGANEESLRFHNHRSSYDNILFNGAFKRVILTGVDPTDAAAVAQATEASISFLKNADASLLQIEPTDTTSYEKALAESLALIYKIGLNQVRSLPTDSGVAQSAETISSEKENVVDLVVSSMEEIETLLKSSFDNYAHIKSVDSGDAAYIFNKKINKRDIQRFLNIYGAFGNLIAKVPELSKQSLIEAVKEMGFDAESEKVALDAIKSAQFGTPSETKEADDIINEVLNAKQQPGA